MSSIENFARREPQEIGGGSLEGSVDAGAERTLYDPRDLRAAIDNAMFARTGVRPEGPDRVMVFEQYIAEEQIPQPAREFLAAIPVEPAATVVAHLEQIRTDWLGPPQNPHEVSRVAFVRREEIPPGLPTTPDVGAVREIRLRYDADERDALAVGRIVAANICDYATLEVAGRGEPTLEGSSGPIHLDPEYHIAIFGERVDLGEHEGITYPDRAEVSQIIDYLRQAEPPHGT
jgi:hypothetical protein